MVAFPWLFRVGATFSALEDDPRALADAAMPRLGSVCQKRPELGVQGQLLGPERALPAELVPIRQPAERDARPSAAPRGIPLPKTPPVGGVFGFGGCF